MQRSLKPIAITVVVLVTAVFAYLYINGLQHTPEASPSPSVSTQVKPATVSELLKLVNEERAKVGVAPLILDERLNQSAQRKVDDMVKYDYNAHVSPHDGKHGYEYINDTGIYCKIDSENYSYITSGILDAKSAVYWWMNSKAHHDAMLDPKYTLTGFGVSDGKAVEHFCEQ